MGGKIVRTYLLLITFLLAASVVAAEPTIDELEEQYGVIIDDEIVSSMGASQQGFMTIIKGAVYRNNDSETLPWTLLDVYCKHGADINKISRTAFRTNDEGSYITWTFNLIPSKKCEIGDEAWLIVHYEGEEWESEHVEVADGDEYDYADVNAYVGVPEFSVWTIGIAVIFGAMGLAFFRSKM